MGAQDITIIQNGSMCDAASVGSHTKAAKFLGVAESKSFALWNKLAMKSPSFGNPQAFMGNVVESVW